jgi:uncharacterized membrane protein
MIILIIGLVLFFAVHSISIVNEAYRNLLIKKWGEGTYKALYSLISVLGFGLIIWGYGLARAEPILLYVPPVWLRHLSLLLLIPVFPLLFATYLPGKIKARLKHPMLVAIKLWAVAHLLVNGMLSDVLLFSTFLIWAVFDRISVKKRTQRTIPTLPGAKYNDLISIVAGLCLYITFLFWVHLWLIGIPIIAI